ncbi:Metallo-dependent phosphatase [Aspergillus sclerotioniger CBS 115572]|uniref:Metallo-dependent phosphatase n=1 Tax=Aspergillus sclerotioniger CBS 115572 TaxID=1450535 RepID=A0A317X6I1_9EURO|nr:Metallo-dependent phosphatase [Aspergillus sclerotioniger CBS 115572]PWY93252.1 Metallo-dependent phosphatase [Aspergillus sclerotioniger CBS 115572]
MDATGHASQPRIKTRFLILSDTHGMDIPTEYIDQPDIDVAIHCGDLTAELHEYHSAIQLLQTIHAPLKLVIAGNHDISLDEPCFRQKVADARSLDIDPRQIRAEFGDYGQARALFDETAGISFLDEGTHRFALANGASLTSQGHEFAIPNSSVDVVLTHGPPRGILDIASSGSRTGCHCLFEAIAWSRPRLHCFGHIHEAWGAKLVTWRKTLSETPNHFADIDHGKSSVVATLATMAWAQADQDVHDAGSFCCHTSHCAGDPNPLRRGLQTLFVNAAVEGLGEVPIQLPWLVDIELDPV